MPRSHRPLARGSVAAAARGAWRRTASGALVSLSVALLAALAVGAGTAAAPVQEERPSPYALDVDELDAATLARMSFRFELDRHALELLGAAHVPGMVVVVAIGGETVAAEAYGTADRASGRTLTLDDPLWVGPLTRTLTAVVVLDLVADGRLALDDPVTAWLPELGSGSAHALGDVTVGHLLAEAAGLDGWRLRAPGEGSPLGIERPPGRVLEPERRIGACPVCTGLLGLVVERASREDLERAFTRRLATPLGLASARLASPSDDLSPPARRHVHTRSGLVPLDDGTDPPPAAAGARMSGQDAARFIVALTRADPGPPFDRGVRGALLTTAARSHGAVAGTTYGLSEAPVMGHDALVQGGGLLGDGVAGAATLLVVVPSGAVAVFVHVNGAASPDARIATADGANDVAWAVAERAVELVLGDARIPPRPGTVATPDAAAATPTGPVSDRAAPGAIAEPVPGPYRAVGGPARGLERLLAPLWLREARLTTGGGDEVTLLLHPTLSAPRSYRPEAPGVFRRSLGGEALAVERDAAGRPLVHTTIMGPVTLELVPPLERVPVVLGTIGAFVLLATLVLASWPVGAFRRWRRRDPRGDDPPQALVRLRILGRVAAAAGLLALAGVAVAAVAARATGLLPPGWVPPTIWATLGVLGLTSVGLAGSTVLAVAGGAVSGRAGLLHAAVAAAGLALLVQAWTWQLLP